MRKPIIPLPPLAISVTPAIVRALTPRLTPNGLSVSEAALIQALCPRLPLVEARP